MDLKKVEKQRAEYCTEFENTEEMDFEKHIQMASKVGLLLRIVREKQDEVESLKEYLSHKEEEKQWLYGKLNQISSIIEKSRNEKW